MKNLDAEPLLSKRFILGEGPGYNDKNEELFWVDIKTGSLYIYSLSGSLQEIQTGQYIGASIPTESGFFIGLMTTGIYLLDREGIIKKLVQPAEMTVFQRFNDAKCDMSGRLWGGVMPLFDRNFNDGGMLFRLDPNGSCKLVLDGLTVPNGIAWDSSGKIMYFIDTPTCGIDAFDFDSTSGSISGRRRAIDVIGGYPDGMTIDAEGMLWVAVWGSGEIHRYDPFSGKLISKVAIPAKNVSSCCFGGKGMKTLYITSSGENEPDNPLAGCVFYVNTDVVGTCTRRFDDSKLL